MMHVSRFLIGTLAFTALALAQSEHDLHEWMESVRTKVGSLRKNLDAKQGSEATADAKALVDIFEKVQGFWDQKKITDASRFAAAAQGGFQQVATAASAGEFDKASAQMKETMSNCAGCHNAHREKTENGFKIRY